MATDSAEASIGPSKEDNKDVSYRGCILEFSYQGMSSNGSSASSASPMKKEE